MKKSKKEKLEAAGWTVGSAEEFLDLTKEEAAFVDMKIALSDSVREKRRAKHLTQTQVAKKIGSSQSRVAKMEAGDPTVSVDLMMKTLLTLGTTRSELARIISKRRPRRAA